MTPTQLIQLGAALIEMDPDSAHREISNLSTFDILNRQGIEINDVTIHGRGVVNVKGWNTPQTTGDEVV